MGYYGGYGPGGGILALAFLVLVWGAIVWAIFACCRAGRSRMWWGGPGSRPGGPGGPGHHHHHGPGPDPDDPETILARRYAAGEIDEEEFHRRLDHLRSRDPQREEEGVWRP